MGGLLQSLGQYLGMGAESLQGLGQAGAQSASQLGQAGGIGVGGAAATPAMSVGGNVAGQTSNLVTAGAKAAGGGSPAGAFLLEGGAANKANFGQKLLKMVNPVKSPGEAIAFPTELGGVAPGDKPLEALSKLGKKKPPTGGKQVPNDLRVNFGMQADEQLSGGSSKAVPSIPATAQPTPQVVGSTGTYVDADGNLKIGEGGGNDAAVGDLLRSYKNLADTQAAAVPSKLEAFGGDIAKMLAEKRATAGGPAGLSVQASTQMQQSAQDPNAPSILQLLMQLMGGLGQPTPPAGGTPG